jgi:hypothetical protein
VTLISGMLAFSERLKTGRWIFFFLISNSNLLKSAKGRNPYTREVYKRAPKRVEQKKDWEVDLFTSFFNFLYFFGLRRGGQDKLCWVPSKKGLFDVKSYYNVLVPYDNTHFLCRSIWWNKAPLRVVFFSWSAALGKILIMNKLRKRYVIMVDWCCSCEKSEESVDHLLVHCEMTNALWNAIFSLVGLLQVMPRRVVDHFACWKEFFGRSWNNVIWKMVPSCFMWWLWRINDRIFEDRKQSVEELKDFFFKTLYHRTTTMGLNISSFHVFLDLFSSTIRVSLCILFVYLGFIMNCFYLYKKKTLPIRSMGLQSLTSNCTIFLGIRAMKVVLRLFSNNSCS